MEEVFEYHRKVFRHFNSREKTWNWFMSDKIKENQLTKFKTDLLKDTYRFERETEVELYQKIDELKLKMGIDSEVTVYQELNAIGYNARISNLPGEIHIVLSGQIKKLLSDDELSAVLAHELAHAKFLLIHDGRYEVTSRIIYNIANDLRTQDTLIETARLYGLYVELYCDRMAYEVIGEINPVVCSLVKLHTGLEKVSASDYIKQSEEILLGENDGTMGSTHPEVFIRCKTLDLWAEKKADEEEEIIKIVEGMVDINNLDIFRQKKLNEMTRWLLQIITKTNWLNSLKVSALSGQYFSDFVRNSEVFIEKTDKEFFENCKKSTKDYFSYILLDFALVDSDMEKAAIGQMFLIAEELDILSSFEKIVKKELKLTAREYKSFKAKASNAVAEMTESLGESILKE